MDTGIFLPGHWFDTTKAPGDMLRELVDQGVLAEELGFDVAWFAEHYFNNYIAQPAPMQIAAVVASRTTQIKLGMAVLVLPFHHPLRLAGELTQLDSLSDGRVVATLGRGAFPFEADQLGISMTNEESRAFCEESVQVLAQTLRSRMKASSHQGKHWRFDNMTIVPPAFSDTTPDVWIAAQQADSARWAVEMCVRNGLRPNIFCSQLRRPFSVIADVYGAFASALEAHGLERADGTFAVNQLVFVADTDEAAVAEVFKTVYPVNRGVYNMQQVGGDAVGHVVDGIVTEAALPDEPSPEELIDNTAIGSPDTVVAKLLEYKQLGVDHLSMHTNIGLSPEVVEHSMRLTATHLLPALR